jgi:branched-chain amino acid transport system substrate-binding protein
MNLTWLCQVFLLHSSQLPQKPDNAGEYRIIWMGGSNMDKVFKGFWLLAVLILVTGIAMAKGDRKAPYVVGAFVSASGPNAPLGVPERDTLIMLEEMVNKKGGIHGHPLKVIIEDDASDNTNAVKAARKLIEQDKACAIIGGTGTGPSLAVAPIAESAGVTQISMAAGIAITSPIKKWVFRVAPMDAIVAGKMLDYFKTKNISRFAIIYDSNAFGSSGRDQLKLLAPKYNMTVVAEESFASKDTDMTVQLTKIRTTNAQAIVCWGTNPGPAQVAKNAQQLAITIPLFMGHGVANQAFIDQAGPAADGVTLAAVKLIVADQLAGSDPQKKVLKIYADAFQKKYGRSADHYGGHAWDALSIIVEALRKAGNDDRAKLRDEIEKTTNFSGIGGVFNYTPGNHDGLEESCVMIKIVKGKWTLLKK